MLEYSLARHRKIRRHTVEKSDKNQMKIKYLAGHGSIEMTALFSASLPRSQKAVQPQE